MAQAIYTLTNAVFDTFLTSLNDHLAAIVTLNSGSSAPGTTFAGMLWEDSTGTPYIINVRDDADAAWFPLMDTDGNMTPLDMTVGGDLGLSASGVNTIWSTFLSVKGQIYPRTNNFAPAATKIDFAASRTEWYTIAFDPSTMEAVQCVPVVLPPDYDGRALTVEILWTGRNSAVPGATVKWRIDTMAHGDGDDLGLTTGQTNVILTDTFQGTADELHRISGTVTPGNRGADDDAISFQIRRVVSDTYTHDAHLIGLRISY